jgi:hypothetical protein
MKYFGHQKLRTAHGRQGGGGRGGTEHAADKSNYLLTALWMDDVEIRRLFLQKDDMNGDGEKYRGRSERPYRSTGDTVRRLIGPAETEQAYSCKELMYHCFVSHGFLR